MKATKSDRFSTKAITLAVQGAIIVMFAAPLVAGADEPSAEVTALTKPTNTVDVGAEYVPKSSAKFGEYNGLDKQGTYMIGNFDLRGGDAYNAANGGDGTKRVEIKGANLGTTSREMSLDISNQGKWNFGFGYDELRHNITDTYHTPFLGTMGGNNFTLPSNFGIIDTKNLTGGSGTTYVTAPGTNSLTAKQLADINSNAPEVYSQRENSKFNAGFVFDSRWNMKFDYNHLVQSGAKLQGTGGDQTNGNPAGCCTATIGALGIAGGSFAGQTPLVLMSPTNYTTDTFNLALNWAGDKGFTSLSYYTSIFRDAYSEVTFSNPFFTQTASNTIASGATNIGNTAIGFPQDAISTMPGNIFNQVNLNGGYNFTPATKLVAGVSYARNTQNDAYSTASGQLGLIPSGTYPQGSLDGVVVTSHADMKLTNQTTKDLQLSASVKYNKHDNQTASNGYSYYTFEQPNSPVAAASVAGFGISSFSTPMSNTKTQFGLEGDYRINKTQKVNMAYEHEEITRSCSGVNYPLVSPNTGIPQNNISGTSIGGVVTSGTGFTGPFTASTCAQVPDSRENKLAATYKLKASESLNFNAGLGLSSRVADINNQFYNPMQTTGANSAAGAGYEIPGFVSYMDATRREQLVKAGMNWEASEKLSFGLNGRYTHDQYDESTFGVQNGKSYSVNFDTTYAESENTLFTGYATTQNMSRDLFDAQAAAMTLSAASVVAPATFNSATTLNRPAGYAPWTNNLKENDLTVGLGAKQGGLMANKLVLSGDVTYSKDVSTYGTQFSYVSATTTGLTCASPQFLTCGNAPDIKSDMLRINLTGVYKIDKDSKFAVGYLFQRLNVTDYFYNAYQYGSTPTTLLPTNQQAPSYSVNVVSVAYSISY